MIGPIDVLMNKDVQLTKDAVPIIYHDFLMSETGIDAPLHNLNLEQVRPFYGSLAPAKTAHRTWNTHTVPRLGNMLEEWQKNGNHRVRYPSSSHSFVLLSPYNIQMKPVCGSVRPRIGAQSLHGRLFSHACLLPCADL